MTSMRSQRNLIDHMLNDVDSSPYIDNISDLHAFERRLMEIIAEHEPPTMRWRIVLTAMSLCTAISAWYWLQQISKGAKYTSLFKHPVFTLASLTLFLFVIYHMQDWDREPKEIKSRIRNILHDFHLDCDDKGRLSFIEDQPPEVPI